LPHLELNRARGTQASPSAVLSGDELGEINFYGRDGSTFIRGASIRSYVDGTPGTNDMPGRLVFSTTADGASSPTERMRITCEHVRLAAALVASSLTVHRAACAGIRRWQVLPLFTHNNATPADYLYSTAIHKHCPYCYFNCARIHVGVTSLH
jgi:hypothetical protein